MRRRVLAVIVLLSSIALSAQNRSEANINYIEVTGRAEKEYVPDQIYTKVVVSEVDSKGKKNLDKIEKELFKALTTIGVDLKKDITVSDMNSTLEKYLLRKDNIAATREYVIMVKNSNELSQLFEATKKLEITDITITHAKLSNPQEVGRVILKEASEDARLNAEAIAEGLGVKVGSVILVQSYAFSAGQLTLATPMAMTRSKEISLDSVNYEVPDFKKIKVTHSVTVRFEIQ